MRFRRREQPPAEVATLLTGEERVLSWADTESVSVVATQLGLWWPADGGGHRRIGWEDIVKATWRDGWLTVIEGDVVDDTLQVARPPVAVRLTVPRDLPPTVRARVEGNIVEREQVSVPGGMVRFVARRRPGHDGLVWWAHLADGTPDDPAVRAAVAARLAILRAGRR